MNLVTKRSLFAAVAAATLIAGTLTAPAANAAETEVSGETVTFTVVAEEGKLNEAAKAVSEAGGSVTAENGKADTLTVNAPVNGFAQKVSASDDVYGAAKNRSIGHAPAAVTKGVERGEDLDVAPQTAAPSQDKNKKGSEDPLDDRAWGLDVIDTDKAHQHTKGSKKVTVGVMDTGVDKTHPDLKRNFNKKLSRSFVDDAPASGGVDGHSHGTHVAGTIAAAADGFGISGVAPKTGIVDLRVANDDGYFFIDPVVNGLTYAGEAGIDVVNMSFYIDPWLFNCASNPADSPEQQAEQRAIITATNRALEYAHDKGVTLISSLGNGHRNMGVDGKDTSSPNFPEGEAHERDIDNETCLSMPAEGSNVINVTATGNTGEKAYYSNWGVEQATVAAPGGDIYFTQDSSYPTLNWVGGILSTYPLSIAQANGETDENGNLTQEGKDNGLVQYTDEDGNSALYAYFQGTSMASPHVSGISALIVDQYGHKDWGKRGQGSQKTLDPNIVEQILTDSAVETACPDSGVQEYPGIPDAYTAPCTGDKSFNDFYGHGMVNAYNAVTYNLVRQ